MATRFRKSAKIAPGVKVSISKKSASVSFGGNGVRKTYSTTGRKTTSVGVPGTGLSYISTESRSKEYTSEDFGKDISEALFEDADIPYKECDFLEPMSAYRPKEKRINKHLFVWLFTFVLGCLGIDRFLRGQIFFGIVKLVTGGGYGIWAFIDFVVAAFKAYVGSFRQEEDFVFIGKKYAR